MIKAVLVPSKLKTWAACMLAVWLISAVKNRIGRNPSKQQQHFTVAKATTLASNSKSKQHYI